MNGKLFLIPTPIGNLEDITLRALKILGEVDIVLAEDTRTAGQLLKHYQLNKRLYAHHQHNEHKAIAGVLKFLKEGLQVALVSDAGTPAISDPGFLLVRACIQEGFALECLPGATAFVPALVNSGLPCDRFCFEGFLPVKKGRQTKMKELAAEERTIVLYESPHRLLKTLNEFALVMGAGRRASVSRELTKVFEETVRGTLEEIIAHYTTNVLKGEFVICIEGRA